MVMKDDQTEGVYAAIRIISFSNMKIVLKNSKFFCWNMEFMQFRLEKYIEKIGV